MNCLGIDYGTKKSWLAVNFSDIAMPHSIVSTDALINEIMKLIPERSIETIVLWVADHPDWRISEISKKIRAFSTILAKRLPVGVSVILHDERFTSFEAAKSMELAWVKKFDPNNLDDVAASIILQSYLDSLN
ncbi:MAG: hypothetical protein ACD_2C00111G0002 [uncultured bacterium (gcode 4)]|uniref:Putative pre-16S rRNA nuclease n=1 Tax=uncultured bacterium (gcode 4) TaxID=1234023 RepID=K2FET6_9BACT|nr:MAG: hypothetical protein ACD_2C00111G0002 [uncultured bacterium (gcode 4)]